MIRRPSPRLIANPSPTIDGLINPVAVAIRNPTICLVRNPHVAVVRHILPIPVSVQILRSGVATVGVMPGIRTLDHVIAVAIPAIPIVAIWSRRDLVLRGFTVAAHGSHISRVHFGAALLGGNLRLARAHDHDRVSIGPHFDAEHAIMMRGMNGYVRGIDLGFGFTVFGNAEVGDALRQLNLNISFCQVRHIGLRVRTQAKNIGKVELQFCAGVVAGGNLVAGHYGLIQRGSGPVSGVPALRGNVGMNQADASHALVGLHRSFAFRSTWLSFSGLRIVGIRVIRRTTLLWIPHLPIARLGIARLRVLRRRLAYLHPSAGLI